MNTFSRTGALSFCVVTGLAVLMLSGAAMATPLLVGAQTNASGIDGIVVDGVTYDVTFSTSSFDSTFSTDAGALDAAIALAADLEALNVTGVNFGGASGVKCTLFVGCFIWAGASTQFEAAGFTTTDGWVPEGGGSSNPPPLGCTAIIIFEGCYDAAHWAVVPASVPEPSTLALSALGLIGVGLSRRRLAR